MFRWRVTVGVATLVAAAGIATAANISVVRGLNPIAIPSVPSLNYNVTNLFPTPYGGDIIYRWNAPLKEWWTFTYFDGFGTWISNSQPVNPTFEAGEGIYYHAVAAQTFVANFHNYFFPEIAALNPVGPPLPLIPNRYYFQGSPSGQSATYEEIFHAPPNNETALFRFQRGGTDINPTGPDYRVYRFKDNSWTPETPVLEPLEAAFVIHPYLSLKYTLSGNPQTITLTWPARGVLEEAPLLAGPWQLVATEGNSYSITQTNRARYYRVKE